MAGTRETKDAQPKAPPALPDLPEDSDGEVSSCLGSEGDSPRSLQSSIGSPSPAPQKQAAAAKRGRPTLTARRKRRRCQMRSRGAASSTDTPSASPARWQARSPRPHSGCSSEEESACAPSRSVSPMTPRELPADPSAAEKHEREVWVGDLPANTSIAAVRVAFEGLLRGLPEYQERYQHLQSPVVAVRVPPARGGSLRFVFVEFEDAVLASTAVSMSGFLLARQSVRVNRPASGPVEEEAARGLDVEPLRTSGQIPWVGGPGAAMLTEIFLGGFAAPLGQNSELLRKELSKARSSRQ